MELIYENQFWNFYIVHNFDLITINKFCDPIALLYIVSLYIRYQVCIYILCCLYMYCAVFFFFVRHLDVFLCHCNFHGLVNIIILLIFLILCIASKVTFIFTLRSEFYILTRAHLIYNNSITKTWYWLCKHDCCALLLIL